MPDLSKKLYALDLLTHKRSHEILEAAKTQKY